MIAINEEKFWFAFSLNFKYTIEETIWKLDSFKYVIIYFTMNNLYKNCQINILHCNTLSKIMSIRPRFNYGNNDRKRSLFCSIFSSRCVYNLRKINDTIPKFWKPEKRWWFYFVRFHFFVAWPTYVFATSTTMWWAEFSILMR